MEFDNSLFEYNAGYYQLTKDFWLPGTMVPRGFYICSKRAVDAVLNVELDDSDILIATYPKTGEKFVKSFTFFFKIVFNVLLLNN